jgi:hypothetical protein
MTQREVAALACRILAVTILALSAVRIIVVAAQVLMSIYQVMRGYRTDSIEATLIGGSVSAVLHLAIVCFLWTHSAWIAKKMVPEDDDARRWPHIRVADLQVAAFSTLGVFSLLYGVSYFCRSLGVYIDSFHSINSIYAPGLTFANWLAMESTLSSLAYAGLGLWLVLGSRQIVRFVRRLRRPEFDDPDELHGPAEEQDSPASPNLVES